MNTPHTLLKNVHTVMVNTSHPGNIGGAARALKNMELSSLRLVNPQTFPHAQATARAAGADDILAHATVTNSIADALKDCQRVFACSARQRHLSWPLVTPKDCAALIKQSLQKGEKVGLVFGNEQSGLDNSVFQHCHYQLLIPSNPAYSSLNLAAAIQVTAYEIYQAVSENSAPPSPHTQTHTQDTLASGAALNDFYHHLETVLWGIRFLNPAHPKRLMQRLQRLFNRAQPTTIELNILRGILTAIEYASNLKK